MKFTGSHVIQASPERVWQALLDPATLVATIPGCERLVATGEHSYDMTVTAGVAAITGTYQGTCELSDLDEPRSLRMKLQGAGAPGTIGADVQVAFNPSTGGETTVSYQADAVVGGMIGGVGQRMLGSVSRRMAGEFFGNVERVIRNGLPASSVPESSPGDPSAATAGVFTAAAKPDTGGFMRGVALGAGLVLLGVLAGGQFGRRGNQSAR